MRSRTALATCFVILLFGASTSGQQLGQIDKDLERQRLQLQAVSMIRQVATEAPLWNDREAAVQALTDAADMLWVDDPAQSVKWLRKAWDITSQVSSEPRDEKLKAFFTQSVQSQLRAKVLMAARKHDPKLADQFLKDLSGREANEKKERGAFDDRTARSEQLLNMAQQVLNAKPEEALSLAEASLTDGLSYKLQNILTSLRQKDVELANRLFDLALARFAGTLPDPSEAQILAGYLFRPGLTFSANSAGQGMLVLNPVQQNLAMVATGEPQRTKRFLIAVYERLLTQPVATDTATGKQRAQQILLLGNLIGRRYDGFAPDLAPSAQGFLAQLQRQLVPDADSGSVRERSGTTSEGDTTKRLTKEEFYEKNISELEEAADRESNPAFKRVAYAKVALATKPEDYIHAQRIAAKIDDDDLRADVASFVLYRAALFFAEMGDIEKAVEIAPTIGDVSRRAVVKITIAQRMLSPESKQAEPASVNFAQQRALDLLADIDRDLKKGEPSTNAAKILLGRTAVLAKVDRDQALASLGRAVEMINKLDRFDLRDGAAPNLGLAAFSASGATVARPKIGFDFRSAIEPLIKIDFEQISAVVERLTTKEVNGSGRLEAAKLYLQKTKGSSSPPRELSGTLKSR